MMALQQHDGFPAAGLETRVDALRFCGDFVEQALVTIDVSAAGCANLNQRKTALKGGIELEETLDTVKALENALGVIHTIDTYAQKSVLNTQFVAKRGSLFVHGATRLRQSSVFLLRDAD